MQPTYNSHNPAWPKIHLNLTGFSCTSEKIFKVNCPTYPSRWCFDREDQQQCITRKTWNYADRAKKGWYLWYEKISVVIIKLVRNKNKPCKPNMKTMWGNNVAEDIRSYRGRDKEKAQQNHNYLTTISVWQILKRTRTKQSRHLQQQSLPHTLIGCFCEFAIPL